MGVWPGNSKKSEENKRLIRPLWLVLERAGSVDATVNGPYWTRGEAATAYENCGEPAKVVQCMRKEKAKEQRPFI